MSLKLQSSFSELDARLRQFDGDGQVSPTEFQWLRDGADRHMADIVALDAGVFQSQADGVVEAMQKLALAARKSKLTDAERAALKEAVEHQLGYVIAGYQSSLQRL
ncbi:hypothetical protein [Luteibacter sp. RCC_6_2]|jgi:hypothetical protein|uniref:hypothetical protein n=1 Tax=Luteibacter sp. RCC_6_2 TaxID=3239223 RepID=UPI0035250254